MQYAVVTFIYLSSPTTHSDFIAAIRTTAALHAQSADVRVVVVERLKETLRRANLGPELLALNPGSSTTEGFREGFSDVDFMVLFQDAASNSGRFDLGRIKLLTSCCRDASVALFKEGIVVAAFPSFLVENFIVHITKEQALKASPARRLRTIPLHFLAYPNVSALLGWEGDPRLVRNLVRASGLVLGTDSGKQELLHTVERAMGSRSGSGLDAELMAAEYMLANAYVLLVANPHLPADLVATDALSKIKYAALHIPTRYLEMVQGISISSWSGVSSDQTLEKLDPSVSDFVRFVSKLRDNGRPPPMSELEEAFAKADIAIRHVFQQIHAGESDSRG